VLQDTMPRYQELRQVLAGEIAGGRYAVGERFPTDFELCRRFKVSRHTVREALRDLQEQGVLARNAGAGTIVCAPSRKTFTQEFNSLGTVFNSVADTRFELRHRTRVVIGAARAKTLGCEPGRRWLRLAGVRWHVQTETPLCWTEIFVNSTLSGVGDAVGDHVGTVYELISQMFGVEVAEVEQDISAVALSPSQAREIGVAKGAPGLLVIRRYYSPARKLFEVAVSVYPGDRFTFKTSLLRSGSSPDALRMRAKRVPLGKLVAAPRRSKQGAR
jgi:GntR family transcriptional regulator